MSTFGQECPDFGVYRGSPLALKPRICKFSWFQARWLGVLWYTVLRAPRILKSYGQSRKAWPWHNGLNNQHRVLANLVVYASGTLGNNVIPLRPFTRLLLGDSILVTIINKETISYLFCCRSLIW